MHEMILSNTPMILKDGAANIAVVAESNMRDTIKSWLARARVDLERPMLPNIHNLTAQ